MKSILYRQLERYCSFGPYPFHMPGHKRSLMPVEDLPYGWDLTEVEGVDDLHEAEGILRQAMDRTARLWRAERTWYLVGGSTCGLLSGIRALAPAGSRIIAARNCHKSVYHAMELGGLQVTWLMPPMLPEGICGSISPEAVKKALEEVPEAACVVLTSPTYEGILSDIASIAGICHEKGVPLLVDEAHGAHLGFAPGWPESALHLGADVVVQSVHKTLPSLTQTALLHLGKGSLADPEEVERQLDVFETSSPSYPLLVSIDGCSQLLAEQGEQLFADWLERIRTLEAGAEQLRHLKILGHTGSGQEGIFAFDPGKLPICTAGTGRTGPELGRCLRERHGLEMEMCQGDICLAMTGMGDSKRAMEHLLQSLLEIDRGLEETTCTGIPTLPGPGETLYLQSEAILRAGEEVPLSRAEGRISGEYVWAYPPGIPLTVPGERITPEFLRVYAQLCEAGTRLHHSSCRSPGSIRLIKEL